MPERNSFSYCCRLTRHCGKSDPRVSRVCPALDRSNTPAIKRSLRSPTGHFSCNLRTKKRGFTRSHESSKGTMWLLVTRANSETTTVKGAFMSTQDLRVLASVSCVVTVAVQCAFASLLGHTRIQILSRILGGMLCFGYVAP